MYSGRVGWEVRVPGSKKGVLLPELGALNCFVNAFPKHTPGTQLTHSACAGKHQLTGQTKRATNHD
jgi:hypothetical protein